MVIEFYAPFWITKMAFLAENHVYFQGTENMSVIEESELRQAAEQNVLMYILALLYEQNPQQLVLERGLTFTPLIPDEFDASDPAAKVNCINVDFDNEDTNIVNNNVLTPLSG